ncbi:MAG: hypothetical protein WAW61_11015 [Methylococcaceae bacterium]
MLRDSGIRYASFSRVFVGAFIVGKVILVADLFLIVVLFWGRPLIYNTFWKTGLYAITALLFRLGKLSLDSLFEYKSILVAQENFLAAIPELRFWAIQLWLVILLVTLGATKELIGAFGPARIQQLYFGR